MRVIGLGICLATGVLIGGPMAVRAGPPEKPVGLIQEWQKLNERCRGGSGNDPETFRACDARTVAGRQIAAKGWCYGRQGEFGYQMVWHACGPTSIRP